ncbi:hypothetical protein FB45DRAFT_945251 [Roridomyces roridus]|uniref:Uncharacterized protein n=1 Tax=Roridomyces roridus TaxID=1738132 RepID=A0AAD7B3N3_9AGAR|nr:hypothetical protein FB45DRAFT_945251 [Roridomyces roridus]
MPIDYPLFLRMLNARRQGSLRSASFFAVEGPDPDPVTLAVLDELRDGGLDLRLESGLEAQNGIDRWENDCFTSLTSLPLWPLTPFPILNHHCHEPRITTLPLINRCTVHSLRCLRRRRGGMSNAAGRRRAHLEQRGYDLSRLYRRVLECSSRHHCCVDRATDNDSNGRHLMLPLQLSGEQTLISRLRLCVQGGHDHLLSSVELHSDRHGTREPPLPPSSGGGSSLPSNRASGKASFGILP